jgi:glucose/arabinose dehydrogenase
VLYVVEQAGRIMRVANRHTTTFFDFRAHTRSGGEQGMLSIAFDPKYASNHFLYVSYTALDGHQRVGRFRVSGNGVVASSQKVLLDIADFASNHNGGQLQFGPDGKLYWSNGDGGGEGDPQNVGQDLSRPFSRIIKLDVRKANAKWQLVAYGLRNPWRFSFDKGGDLYIGDVGQDRYEEIDYLPRGFKGVANFGWKRYEGNSIYDAGTKLASLGHYVKPIVVYSHSQGCSVTGGFTYLGRYFYGDYCSGTIWSLVVKGGRATSVRREPFTVQGLSSFGEDAASQLYAMSVSTGALYKLAG